MLKGCSIDTHTLEQDLRIHKTFMVGTEERENITISQLKDTVEIHFLLRELELSAYLQVMILKMKMTMYSNSC